MDDAARLGIGPGILTNAESGETVAVIDGKFSLDLPAYGVGILRFESGQL